MNIQTQGSADLFDPREDDVFYVLIGHIDGFPRSGKRYANFVCLYVDELQQYTQLYTISRV